MEACPPPELHSFYMVRKTVLVLGAGASHEVGLPVGNTLKDLIGELLNFKIEDGEQWGGSTLIMEALMEHAVPGGENDPHRLVSACQEIVDALPQVLSIDNYLHQRGDSRVSRCGKLAIVEAIIGAEERSKLMIDESGFRAAAVAGTWFNHYWMILTEGCRRDTLAARLGELAVISFNYDRCFEHFLFHSLKNVYRVSDDEAAALVAEVEIYHPYGTVGTYPALVGMSKPWAPAGPAVGYGKVPTSSLLSALALQIKTFAEGTDPGASEISSIRRVLDEAERILYLGFAFWDQNLALLYGKEDATKSRAACFGTTYGFSLENEEKVEVALRNIGRHSAVTLHGRKCAEFVAAYSRLLAFRPTSAGLT